MSVIKKISRRLSLASRALLTGEEPVQARTEIPPITAEEVAEIKAFFPRDKFFIFGHARSGTTILARLIRLHPEITCNWQAHFFTRQPLLSRLVMDEEVERWLKRRSNRWNRGRDLSPIVLRAAADMIMEREALREGTRIVGDKSPSGLMNGEAVRLLHDIYPDAHLIFIVRDGRDTALSHRFQTFIDAPQHLSKKDLQIRKAFARNSEPFFSGEKSVFTENGLRKEALGWLKNVVETEKTGKDFFGEAYLSLRYEDLIADPKSVLCKLWAFLGVQDSFPGVDDAINGEMNMNLDQQWQKEKARDIAEPLKKGKAGSWQDLFTTRDKAIFKEIAGELLINWGYEKDLNW